MNNKKTYAFNGFSRETLDFLKKLGENNNKPWFEARKGDYQKYLLEPFKRLVADLSEFILTIDTYFEVRPAVNKTISRIYRDTRFSKDKALFRNTMWLTFKRPGKNWQDSPVYFFELSPRRYRYGMGFYGASPRTMKNLRAVIDSRLKEFKKILSIFAGQKKFVLEGEEYKRVFDKTKPKEIQNWYQRKNLYLVCNRKIDDRLMSKELVNDLVSGFGLLADFYHFFRYVQSYEF